MRSLFLTAVLLVSGPAFGSEAAAPETFRFGEGLEAHQALFDTACTSVDVRVLDPAQMRLAQETLEQADCEGYDFNGAPRHAEFVFADGVLTHVWILTTAEEEAALRAEFESVLGAPSHVADAFFAFTQGHTAIRRDVPEVLFYGEDFAPHFANWFDSAAAE